MFDSSRTIVNLVGGIGNQLFILYAGLYWSMKAKRKVAFNLATVGLGGTNHGVLLNEFDLPSEMFCSSHQFPGRMISLATRRMTQRFGSGSGKVLGHFHSQTLGYDENLELHLNLRSINGYFQTYRYFDFVSQESPLVFSLKRPSKWYLEWSNRLRTSDVTAVHIRRGDYLKQPGYHGVLDSHYYKRAIEEVNNSLKKESQYVVFSDDIDLAQILMNHVYASNIIYVEPPPESSAIESLLLMSQCSSLVMANSTYSWWAANLGREKLCLIPEPWSPSAIALKDLYRDSWIRVPSSWEYS